ncbi:DUF1758 domain-containing protein [Trichonephila clavipes]|nr:DUF1758 domain-containing protein [Trichonephila clavipes]
MDEELHNILQDAVSSVNYIKYNSLNSRLFSILCNELGSTLSGHDQTTVSVQKLKEQFEKAERLKQLEYEDSGKIRIPEMELARIKATLQVFEFRQFSGDIKDWLQFWSQFKHIHDDDEITAENKFEYLVQATINGSLARGVEESFPATAANYAKAAESLKAIFGRDDLLVEVYI